MRPEDIAQPGEQLEYIDPTKLAPLPPRMTIWRKSRSRSSLRSRRRNGSILWTG